MTAMAATVRAIPDRADQRNALLAGFLGWTLDAFDFFVLVMVLDAGGPEAKGVSFRKAGVG